ncbi:MAG: hypothetical protein JWO46_3484, partial [Nocardioidaceae bacterium]|nr:hypothetical protein [Nocardioidaceae bacterium]
MTWMLDAGLPRPLCNVPVFDREGHHLGTPDLLDPRAGLVVEYDGALHLSGRRRSRDIAREERLRSVGLEYLTVVAQDDLHPDRLVERMTWARKRAAWTPEHLRPWVVAAAPSWHRAASVVERRRRHAGRSTGTDSP